MPQEVYDCIVVGFGGVGSAALRESAKRGWNVLGLDRIGPAHDQGSSHGQSRIIRRAYFEHPNYVPLVDRAVEMWKELNQRHRTSPEIKELITKTGLLQVGNPDSKLIQGVQSSADLHGLEIEQFSSEDLMRRLPIFKVQSEQIGLYEPDAALLRVELCVAAAVNQAIKLGAQIRSNVEVTRWSVEDNGRITVQTDQGEFQCERLILAGGGWSSTLLPDLGLSLKVLKKQQHWFQLDRVDQKIENEFPCFFIEKSNGDCFYGFPEIDYLGMKICEHSGGTPIDLQNGVDRGLDQLQLERTEAFMKEFMVFGRSRLVHHSICFYTMSADEHFMVDSYPGLDNVVFAAGLSGHGFKFAPVLGKQLVDLLDGTSCSEMEFLKLSAPGRLPQTS